MSHQPKIIYEFGPYRLDTTERQLLRENEAIPLQPKIFDLLLALVERRGRLLEKDELMKLIWPDTVVEEANLANNISILRKTLNENGERFIETVPKRGYRFVATVTMVADELAEFAIQEQSGSQTVVAESEQAANTSELLSAHPAVKADGFAGKVKRHKRVALIVLAVPMLSSASLFYFILKPPLPPKVTGAAQITTSGRGKSFYSPTMYRMSSALVTDGPRLYFTEWTVPTQVASAGGETVKIPESFSNSAIGDISPNRSELLVSQGDAENEGSLWVLPVLGGAPRRLGDLLGHDATWTPDGRQIVYANGSSLYLAKSDGSESRKWLTVDGRPYWPRWSPSGNRLRFTVTNPPSRSASLWEVGADGSNLHPLLPGWNSPANECCGNWTADGRYFVFQSTHNRTTNIWARREQRGFFERGSQGPVQLTFGPLNYYFPTPSLDGKKLFVVGDQKRGELVRYDAKTQQLVSYLGGISAEYLAFSTDGEWVAYVTYPEGILWRSKVNGEQRRQLSFSPMQAVLPRWSPDGKQIVFTASTLGKPWKIYLVSADGGGPQQLTPDERREQDPGWSPDGKKLVFAAGTDRELSGSAIYLLEMETRQLSKLPGSDGLYSPRWSPDGRYIAAHNVVLQNKLLLFDLTTQNWTELFSGRRAGAPHWSRDGRYIYFVGTHEDGRAIFRVGIGDRKIDLWASLKGARLAQGVFGAWNGWTLDDQPLMLRDEGTQDVYALEWQTP